MCKGSPFSLTQKISKGVGVFDVVVVVGVPKIEQLQNVLAGANTVQF